MIAHGRGEAFDYLLGERTSDSARRATEQAAAVLRAATNPIISVNGNTAVLAGRELIECAALLSCSLEVNIFYRTPQRMKGLIALLTEKREELMDEAPAGWVDDPQSWSEATSSVPILGANGDGRIPGLEGPRARCEREGILSADAVLVPLEDGDRCEALVNMGLKVIVIDLNPLSRSARMANLTVVDEVSRFASNLRTLLLQDPPAVDRSWDNQVCLQDSLRMIVSRFAS
jgi:4-phosphopantoate--beta-alanine ligase